MNSDDIKRLADAARRAKANAQPVQPANTEPSPRELRRREMQRQYADQARRRLHANQEDE